MKLNSTTLGIIILTLFFGGLAIASAQGWWQTGGSGQQKRNQGGNAGDTSEQIITVRGAVVRFDSTILELTTLEGTALSIETGNARYNQSIGFAPIPGEEIVVSGFLAEGDAFNAVSITIVRTGQVYTFRDETGHPLWSGGNGKGNGGNH